jgi:uncharacterized protein
VVIHSRSCKATFLCLATLSALILGSCTTAPSGGERAGQVAIKTIPEAGPSSDVAVLATASLIVYRKIITSQDNSRCIFTPTCSQYMEEAVRLHGISGIIMGIDRLTRCHPANVAVERHYAILPDGTLDDPVK